MTKKSFLLELLVSLIINLIFYVLLILLNSLNSISYLFGLLSAMIYSGIMIRLEYKE